MSKEAGVALQMIDAGDETRFAMVITHDCDCVADPEQEDQVEVILGSQIGKPDGNYTHGKNPRKLHLELSQCGKLIELVTMPRVALEKVELFAFTPDYAWTLSREEKTILVRWLASQV